MLKIISRIVLDRSIRPEAHLLRPNTIQAQMPRLAILLAKHPFPTREVHGTNETSSNKLQVSSHGPASLSPAVTLPTISQPPDTRVPLQRLCSHPPLYIGDSQ